MRPDFLCIGAPRSGTTWLYENLKAHPEIWIPPVKEIHYFDEKGVNLHMSLPYRLIGKHWLNRMWRASTADVMRTQIHRFKPKRLLWGLNYSFGDRKDEWYLSLFEPGRGRKTGDFTPDYAPLDVKRIAHIHRLMPNVKIIYFMRNPIERTWSHCKMVLAQRRGRRLEDVPEHEFLEYFERSRIRAHNNYAANLARWQIFVPSERIFVGFFDEMAENPGKILKRVFAFLGINTSSGYIRNTVSEKVNSGVGGNAMPEKYARTLTHLYHDDIRRIHERFGGVTGKWLRSAEKFL